MPAIATDIRQFEYLRTELHKDPLLIKSAIRTLLSQQFLFAQDRGCGELYRLLTDYDCQPFFEAYFDCMGLNLQVDRFRQIIALMPGQSDSTPTQKNMRVDEVIMILLCKAEFEAAIQRGAKLEEGNAPWHTDGLYDAWRASVGREPPIRGRMIELLRQMKWRNLISGVIPPALAEGVPFAIRPSIALAVPGDAVQQLVDRAANAMNNRNDDATNIQTSGTAEPALADSESEENEQ